ncbi:MAG TPA: hypothetical protein VKA19_10745 [Alphaproteobacteria bacterium]|nr:hypothetical protein [Alphaproteobacteria bacterium]
MTKILSRFSEASSWAAIGGILVLFGLHIPSELYQHLANVAAAIAFVIGFIRKETGSSGAAS